MSFDSKLVRLLSRRYRFALSYMFRFQTGSIKSRASFDSKLVRLKGFVKAMHILYAILMGRVKSIFRLVVFKVALLSTSGSAKLLGG